MFSILYFFFDWYLSQNALVLNIYIADKPVIFGVYSSFYLNVMLCMSFILFCEGKRVVKTLSWLSCEVKIRNFFLELVCLTQLYVKLRCTTLEFRCHEIFVPNKAMIFRTKRVKNELLHDTKTWNCSINYWLALICALIL